MRVLQFFTMDAAKDVRCIIWYSQDGQRRSQVVSRVEQYLRRNKLICIMDVVKWYQDRKDFDKDRSKAKFDYIFLSSE